MTHPRLPLPTLVGSLARADWGPLAGHRWQSARRLLQALTDLIDRRSGRGKVTWPQLAAAAGCSERTITRAMALLEAAGVVECDRGYVLRGECKPSIVKVLKTVLVEWIQAGREAKPARKAADAVRREERLAKATVTTNMAREYLTMGLRKSLCALGSAVSATLAPHPSKGGNGTRLPRRPKTPTPPKAEKPTPRVVLTPAEQAARAAIIAEARAEALAGARRVRRA